MFIWYWTAGFGHTGSTSIDREKHAWTDTDYVGYCLVKPSDCCLMVPPIGWDCD